MILLVCRFHFFQLQTFGQYNVTLLPADPFEKIIEVELYSSLSLGSFMYLPCSFSLCFHFIPKIFPHNYINMTQSYDHMSSVLADVDLTS